MGWTFSITAEVENKLRVVVENPMCSDSDDIPFCASLSVMLSHAVCSGWVAPPRCASRWIQKWAPVSNQYAAVSFDNTLLFRFRIWNLCVLLFYWLSFLMFLVLFFFDRLSVDSSRVITGRNLGWHFNPLFWVRFLTKQGRQWKERRWSSQFMWKH